MIREPRHSILMITYNQEKYVSSALDSVLSQQVLPYEIIISDDASTDNTWEIIQTYQKEYPEIIKAKTNEINLGVYGNLNTILKTAMGDVISLLAGDDFYKPDLLKELNRVISKNNINIEVDKFVIVPNFEYLWANGSTSIYNNYRLLDEDIFKQRVRYGVFNREIGISKSIIDEIDFYRTDIGVHADWLLALDIDNTCEKHYFTPFVSSVYRTGVGIVSKTVRTKIYESRIKTIKAIKSKFKEELDEKDLKFLNYELSLNNYLIEDTFYTYIQFLRRYILNIRNFAINNPAYSRECLLTLLPPKMRTIKRKIKENLKKK